MPQQNAPRDPSVNESTIDRAPHGRHIADDFEPGDSGQSNEQHDPPASGDGATGNPVNGSGYRPADDESS